MANIEQNYDYTDDNIRTLEGVEHIRRRPGMYIGRLGNGSNPGDGIYVLLKEIVDNCIDEFSAGFGKQVLINIEDRHEIHRISKMIMGEIIRLKENAPDFD